METLKYPFEYFLIQSIFAQVWFRLSGYDESESTFFSTINNKTTLSRELSNHGMYLKGADNFRDIISSFNSERNVNALAKELYSAYLMIPKTKTSENKITSLSVGYSFNEKTKSLRTHYKPNPINGKSALAKVNRKIRLTQYKQVFREIVEEYPLETPLVEFTWLYNLEAYTWIVPMLSHYFTKNGEKLLNAPENIVYGAKMYPKDDKRYNKNQKREMSFDSWAIWGQFLHKNFQINTAFFQYFIDRVQCANTIEELVDSFPLLPLYHECTLKDWTDHLLEQED